MNTMKYIATLLLLAIPLMGQREITPIDRGEIVERVREAPKLSGEESRIPHQRANQDRPHQCLRAQDPCS
jgi:hypothetical protein